ncbi:MAG: POTRA domain-containing protein, partial [Bacteroidota bacterium]|nr:POTRA domain-containing protein [Bacteroidota bacterium]
MYIQSMKSYFLTLFFLLPVYGSAQQSAALKFDFPDSTLILSKVICLGNNLTKQYVIENEMSLKPGDLITYKAVAYDVDRIYSLRLFTKVNVFVLPDSVNTATLIITVHERWYFYPYPLFGFKDRDFSKIYYGAGLIHNNFDGRNVRVNGQFALGYDPFVSLGYNDPLFYMKRRIFFSTQVYYTEQRNRSLVSIGSSTNFDERRWGGSLSIGKRYTNFTSITTTLEYLNLNVSDNK